jgi:hypothetical protein
VVTRKGGIISVNTPELPPDVAHKALSYVGNQWGSGPGSRQLICVRSAMDQPHQWGPLVTAKNACHYWHAGIPCTHQGRCNNYHATLGSIMSDLPRRDPVVIGKIPRHLRSKFAEDIAFHASKLQKLKRMQKEHFDLMNAASDSDDASDEDPSAAYAKFAEAQRAAKRAKHSHPAEPSHSAEPAPEVEAASPAPASEPAPEVEAAPPAPASAGTAGESTPEEEKIVTV